MTEDEFKFAVNMVLNHFGQETKAAYNVRTGVDILMTEREALRQRVAELEANEKAYEQIIGPKSYQEVADKLAALKSGQGEPVAEVVDGDLGPRLVWSFFDVKAQVGTKLYTSAPTMPEGYVMVPIIPTPEMIEAGRPMTEGDYSLPFHLWKNMLAAAPKVGQEE